MRALSEVRERKKEEKVIAIVVDVVCVSVVATACLEYKDPATHPYSITNYNPPFLFNYDIAIAPLTIVT